MNSEFRSRVYTERPAYADYDSPSKFAAIQGFLLTRLFQHPKAICSYSGGADSDILIDRNVAKILLWGCENGCGGVNFLFSLQQ